MRKPKTNAIFVGTNWNNMVVINNPEGKSATTIQKRILSHASTFGYEQLVAVICSGNWDEIYHRAFKVSEIGVKNTVAFRKADPINNRGLITRAIIIKHDRIFMYYWNVTSGRWNIVNKKTLFYTSSADARANAKKEIPAKDETPTEKAVLMDTTMCRVSHVVSADNTDLTVAVINTLVQSGVFPLIIDKDERGNLVVETETGRVLVAA